MFVRHLMLSTLAMFVASVASAQQVTIGAPFNTVKNNFYEQMNVPFGFSIKGGGIPTDDRGPSSTFGINPFGQPNLGQNIQVNQGPAPNPVFGGFNPGATTVGGFGVNAGNFGFNLGFSMGQGNNQTMVSQTPMVTMMNGQAASFSDQVQQPFVTSITPVVNAFGQRTPYMAVPVLTAPQVNPVLDRYRRLKRGDIARARRDNEEAAAARRAGDDGFEGQLAGARESSAGRPALSVAEIRKQQVTAEAKSQAEALDNFQRGEAAEAKGKLSVAKIFYRMAARQADGELKQKAEQRLRAISYDK